MFGFINVYDFFFLDMRFVQLADQVLTLQSPDVLGQHNYELCQCLVLNTTEQIAKKMSLFFQMLQQKKPKNKTFCCVKATSFNKRHPRRVISVFSSIRQLPSTFLNLSGKRHFSVFCGINRPRLNLCASTY